MKKIVITSFVVGFLLLAHPVFAQSATSTTNSADIIKRLQEQIKALLVQVENLTAELITIKKEVAVIKEALLITKTLKVGVTDEEVKKLQEFLSTMPEVYPEGLVTGYFGPLTERAVKKWQEMNGIESVGIVGPRTRSKLSEITSESTLGGVPPGLLTAPGIEKKLETVTSATPGNVTSTTTTATSTQSPNTTPSGTITAVPATPATPATPTSISGTATAPAISATPATPAQPTSTATTTTTSTADTTPPVISNVQAVNITATGATITWTTNESSDSRVDYSYNPTIPLDSEASIKIDPGGPVMTTSHSLGLENQLVSGTTYRYRVESKDAAFNAARSVEYTFTTLVAGPPAPTNVQAVTTSGSQSQPPQMWYYLTFNYTLQSTTQSFNVYRKRPTDASFVKYTYSAQTPVNPSILPIPGSGESNLYHREANQWQWWTTLPAPAPDTTQGEYKFYVTAVDTSGVEGSPSDTKSFKLYAAPVITSPADGSTISSPFTITVSGDPNAPSPTYGMAIYKKTTGDTAWSAWPAPSTSFAYTGSALNSNDNPHRLVVWFSSGASDRSLFSTSIFNVSTTTAFIDLRAQNLAAVAQTLDSIKATLIKLLQQI